MPCRRLILTLFALFIVNNNSYGLESTPRSASDSVAHLIFETASNILKLHESVDDNDDEQQPPFDFGSMNEEVSAPQTRNKRNVPFPVGNIPVIDVEVNRFRHGYIPFTGYGNREEMIIKQIVDEKVFVESRSPMISWQYVRFNSSDFIMLHAKHEVHVWQKMFGDDEKRFYFDVRYSLCSVGDIKEGEVLMALLYARTDHFIETLHFAYVVRSQKGTYKLHNHAVSMDNCKHSTVIELDNRKPLALRFVQKHNEASLFILYNAINEMPEIKCVSCERRLDTKVVTVSVAYAIDLELFVINGNAYAALAQSTGMDVYIFEATFEESKWVDRKRIHDITDLISFRIGFKHFLGIATKAGPQYLMLWNDEQFVAKQMFDIKQVIQWSAIHMSTCREDVILIFNCDGHKAPIPVYVWNGNMDQFELTIVDMRGVVAHEFDVRPFTETSIIYNKVANVLLLDTNGIPHSIAIHTELTPVIDPVFVTQNRITNILRLISERFGEQKNAIGKMKEVVTHAVRDPGNGNLFILVKQVFKSIEAKNVAILHRVNNLKKAMWYKSSLSLEEFQKHQLKDLVHRFNRLKAAVNDIRHELRNNVVYRNRPAFIEGKVTFKDRVESRLINAGRLHIERVMNERLSPILNDVFHVGVTKTPINGTKTFLNPIGVTGNLETLSVNGLRFSRDVVLSDRSNKIRGTIRMRSLNIKNHLNLIGKLNDLNVPGDLIFLRGKKYEISAPKKFMHSWTIIDSLVTKHVDGVDIDNLPNTVLMKYGNQHITSLIITQRVVYMKNILVKGNLNGLNFNRFIDDLVRVDQPTRITASKRFLNNLLIRNDLKVGDTINGLRVPFELVTTDTRQQIIAPKSFRGSVTFMEPVQVSKFVNGIVFPADVIRLDDPSPIKTKLVFEDGITVRKDVHVDGLVDGVNIRDLDAIALKREANRIRGATVFQGPVFVSGNMDISGTANGILIQRLYNDAIFKDSRDPIEIPIRGRKRFNGRVTIVDDLEVQTINARRLRNFVTTNSKQGVRIDSKLIFNAPVDFKNVAIESGKIGSVNIPTLVKRRLSLTEKGRIVGGQHFQKINVKKLIVKGLVNRLQPETDFVLKGTQQLIKATKIFNGTVTFEAGLVLKKNLVAKRGIHGVDISHIAANRITLSGDQLISTSISFANSTFQSLKLRRGKTFNEIDFNEFVHSILYKNGYQVIIAPKSFRRIIATGNITSGRGINGVSLWYLKNHAMKLYGDQVIGASGFEDDLIVNGKVMIEGGFVNGVHLNHFAFDAMSKFKPNIMKGENTFLDGFVVKGNIHTNWVNGFTPSTDLFMKTGDNQFHGNMKFEELVINGNAYLKGLVNGIDLVKFDRSIMKTNRPNHLHGDITFTQQLDVTGNLYVTGHINDADFTRAVNNGFKIYGNQEIPGALVLQSKSTFFSNIFAEKINGIDIRQFLEDLVYINSKEVQLITAPKHLVNTIRLNKHLRHDYGETRIFGPINNMNLIHLANSVIRVDRPAVITGELIFKDKVYIRSANGLQLLGKINGVNFNDIVLLHNNPGNELQVIKSLRLNNLIADDNIIVRGFLNGINLSKEAGNTLLKYGDQYISGNKFAERTVALQRGAAVRRLNDFNDLRDILLINENRTITGCWTFDGPFQIHGNLNIAKGDIAEDLHKLSKESMKTNQPQSITHPIAFERVVFEKDIHINSLINGVNVSYFSAEFNVFKQSVDKSVERIRDITIDNFLDTEQLLKVYRRPNFGLDYFTYFQELNDVRGTYFETHGKYSFAVSNLNRARDKATIHSLSYNQHMRIFEKTKFNTEQRYSQKKIFTFSGLEYVIYQSSPKNYSASVLEQNRTVISFLGVHVDEIRILINKDMKEVLLATLSSVFGEVNIFILQKVREKHEFRKLTTLVVGPETNKIELFQIEKWYFVAVARSFQHTCPTSDTGSLVFQWENREHFRLIQRLPSHANDVLYYSNNDQHYLVFSDVTPIEETKETPGILVYRYTDNIGCPFTLFQKLAFDNLKSMTAFSFGPGNRPELFLCAINSSSLLVWRQDGHSGFTQNWPMRVIDGQFVEPVFVGNRLFLIVGQRKENTGLLIFEAITEGYSRLPLLLETTFNLIDRS